MYTYIHPKIGLKHINSPGNVYLNQINFGLDFHIADRCSNTILSDKWRYEFVLVLVPDSKSNTKPLI